MLIWIKTQQRKLPMVMHAFCVLGFAFCVLELNWGSLERGLTDRLSVCQGRRWNTCGATLFRPFYMRCAYVGNGSQKSTGRYIIYAVLCALCLNDASVTALIRTFATFSWHYRIQQVNGQNCACPDRHWKILGTFWFVQRLTRLLYTVLQGCMHMFWDLKFPCLD